MPSKPGGGYDAYSRLIQPFLEQRLDIRIAVENRPEAGGIVSAMNLRDARPDGSVLGIINTPGLLTSNIIGTGHAPDPASDFSVLGRITDIQFVVFTGRDSGISTAGELFATSASRPVLVGVRDAGSSSFISVPVMAALLGIDYALVTGYVGTMARTLGTIRGEVDIVVQNFDSSRRYVNSGELVPLLQLSGEPVAIRPPLPMLTDLAPARTASSGLSRERAQNDVAAFEELIGSGRIIAAPAGLPEPLAECLGDTLMKIWQDPDFLEVAKRAHLRIAPLSRQDTAQVLQRASAAVPRFEPWFRSALDQARQ